jgi:hypothetical protein
MTAACAAWQTTLANLPVGPNFVSQSLDFLENCSLEGRRFLRLTLFLTEVSVNQLQQIKQVFLGKSHAGLR